MSPADWRALIEAYLEGRLSAEAFMRRFVDGWRNSAGSVPRAIAAMQTTVEGFEADVLESGEEGAVSDDELRQAAQRALANLGEEPTVAPHTPPRNMTAPISERGKPSSSATSPTGYGLYPSMREYPASRALRVAAINSSAVLNSAITPWRAAAVVGSLTWRSPCTSDRHGRPV